MLDRRLRRPARRLGSSLAVAMAALLLLGSLAPLATPTRAQAAPPVLTAPADGADLDGLPLFAWTQPDAPVGALARLEVATDPGLTEIVVAVETAETSYQQIQELDRGIVHWWRVGLRDADGDATWSATWRFTLTVPTPVEPTPEPTDEPTIEATVEPPATLSPAPTETSDVPEIPTDTPRDTSTSVPSATPEPPIESTPSPTGTATGPVGAASSPSVTRTPKPIRTATPARTATPRPSTSRAAIPPSRLSGDLPPSAGLPLAGASRSNGSRTSTTVTDRDLATIWTSPATTPRDASVTVKLDRSRSIGEIRWMWGLRYRGDRVRIEVSRDQLTWTRVATVTNAPTGVWQSLEVNVYTKYIRFRFENPNRDTWVGGLAEVEVYAGARVVDPAPTATATPTPRPQPDGIVTDASFERRGSGWSMEPGAGVVEGVARGGTRSIRLMPEGSYAGQWVELDRGTVYEVSAWGKLGRPHDVGNVGILFFGADGARLRSLEPRMLPFTTTTFTRATLRFAVPERVDRVVVSVYKVLGGSRLYVDDLHIRRVSGSVPPDPPRVTCQSLMLPGYFDPATGLWDQATGSGTGIDIAVFNPESGPDTWFQPAYAEKIAQARAAGQRPFAYVYTAYGARPIADVLRDIETFEAWYGIVDIFLDNGATTYELVPYFRTVMGAIHANGGVAVVNYGWWPHPAYMEFTDIANIFEDTAHVYETNYQRPSWILNYPASRFSIIVHHTPADRMDEVIALSRQRNAAYVWISDDDGPVLYKDLPTYWDDINAAVRAGC